MHKFLLIAAFFLVSCASTLQEEKSLEDKVDTSYT